MILKKQRSKITKTLLFSSLLASSSLASASFDITLAGLNSFSTAHQTAFTEAEAFWENIITGYQPDYQKKRNSPDLTGITINTTSITSDGVGGVLGSAGPTGISNSFYYHYDYAVEGVMNFDPADLSNLESNGSLLNIIKHEMAHVLGLGTLWVDNGLYNTGSGEYTGAAGLSAYQAEFDAAATFIPVELEGGTGTANGHWNEKNGLDLTGITDSHGNDMRDELMTGIFYNNGETFLSNTTIASFQDLGYTVAFPVAVPVPAAIWFFASALGLLSFTRKNKKQHGSIQTTGL